MAVNELVKQYDISKEELELQLAEIFGDVSVDALAEKCMESAKDFRLDTIIQGRVLDITGNDVIVDIGYKCEGIVPLEHFEDPSALDIGDTVEVLLEHVEDEMGLILLSKRKADRIINWERVIANHDKGDVVKGRVMKKIKGGLLVDIGVPVFLPASQISNRRVGDISQFIGREIESKIIKIDESRMNIVVSRRRLIEEQREKMKQALLANLKEGDIVKGTVKNIADFGAFVDLGGIDGLLHITDMSWGRVNHPSEMVAIDEEIEVKVIRIDRDRERISLGLKQKSESPWETVEVKYPVGAVVKGKVVNVLSYGAFVKLEEGVEGLVHISEMSWTKRIEHPSQVVNISDDVDVMVLDINVEKQEISLGMKQTAANPWDVVEEKYPVGSIIDGKIRDLKNYGAFVQIEEGIDGLLHVSDLSWTKKILHPSEVLKKGDEIRAMVLTVDPEKKRIALGLKQMSEDPWRTLIPDNFPVGSVVLGTVTKITNFGVFVRLDHDLEGLLHISELADRKVEDPTEIVSIGERVPVKIIKLDSDERKIGLSYRLVVPQEREPFEEEIASHNAENKQESKQESKQENKQEDKQD